MAKRKADPKSLDGVSLTCNVCVAEASTPAVTVTQAREYVARKWQWIVTPSGHDLCPLCVKRGELDSPEHQGEKPAPKKKGK